MECQMFLAANINVVAVAALAILERRAERCLTHKFWRDSLRYHDQSNKDIQWRRLRFVENLSPERTVSGPTSTPSS